MLVALTLVDWPHFGLMLEVSGQTIGLAIGNFGNIKHAPSKLLKSGLPLKPLKVLGPNGRFGQTLY